MIDIFNRKNSVFYPLVLLIITFIVLFPVLMNNFQYEWDDQWMVMNRYTEGGLGWKNLWAILTEYYHGQYGPVNEYQFLFLYSAFGYTPFPFHLYSLLLHVGSCLLVYCIIVKIFKVTTHLKIKNEREIAFLSALIFSIHPMNVEAVAWISAVKIINYAFFYLAATYTFILYIERKKIKYFLFTILLFILSFGGKEQAVTFPVWLTMLWWLLGCRFKSKRFWLSITPLYLLALFFGFVTMWSQADAGAGVLAGEQSYPMWQRMILACYSLFEYITKLVAPYNLLFVYPFPIAKGEPLPSWMLLYPSIITIIVLTLWKYICKWPVASGFIFFLIHIAITLHIVPISRYAIVADRYVYISSSGFAFIIAYYALCWYRKSDKNGRIILVSVLSCILLTWGIFSNIRAREWYDSTSIKKDLRELIKQNPGYIPPKEDIDIDIIKE